MNKYKVLFSADSMEDISEITKYLREKYASLELSKNIIMNCLKQLRAWKLCLTDLKQ